MNEVQWLFVVLAALYGWECACWLRRGAVAFTSWLGETWRAWHPGTLVGNQYGGFILAPPLPPLGTLFVARQFPLSISAEGVLAFVATNVNPGWRPAQSGRFVRFADLRETRARGCKVLVNGEVLIKCASPGLARRGVEQLQGLAKMKPAQRDAALAESLRGAFDAGAVERRRQEFQQRVRAVRGLSNGLVGYVFVVLPAVIWHFFRLQPQTRRNSKAMEETRESALRLQPAWPTTQIPECVHGLTAPPMPSCRRAATKRRMWPLLRLATLRPLFPRL